MADLIMTAAAHFARDITVRQPNGDPYDLTGYSVTAWLYVSGERQEMTVTVATPSSGVISLSVAVPDAPYQVAEVRVFKSTELNTERICTLSVHIRAGETIPEGEELPEVEE